MGEELPPRVRQQLMRVQQTRENLQYISALLLQTRQQLAENKNAQGQIKGFTAKSIIYQASGPLLFKTTKAKATKDLTEQIDSLEARVKKLEKQEAELKKHYETLQETLRGMLGQPDAAPAG